MTTNLQDIYRKTILAVTPGSLVQRALSHWDFSDKVAVIALGKAGAAMMMGAKKVLGSRLVRGFLLTKYGHFTAFERERLETFSVIREAGHPVPDIAGLEATRELVDWLKSQDAEELLVLCSGGASSLLVWPTPPLELGDLKAINEVLLRSGLPIETLNILRKHISEVKGGRLSALSTSLYRRTRQVLMVDICAPQLSPDEILSLVASGPFAADPSCLQEAEEVLDRVKGDLNAELLGKVRLALRETPKQSSCQSQVLASHETLRKCAESLVGENLLQDPLWNRTVLGEVRRVAEDMSQTALRLRAQKSCGILVASGEPTVDIRSSRVGRGGRCQELALHFARAIAGRAGIRLLAGSSDGTDGPTEDAGALVDGSTWPELCRRVGEEKALDLLDTHDSGSALSLLSGSLLVTGPTGQNLNDLYLLQLDGTQGR